VLVSRFYHINLPKQSIKEGGDTMENLEVGLQLLVVGVCIVFFILVLLMYIMKTMSALVGKYDSDSKSKVQSQTAVEPGSTEDEQELAVVLAVALDTVAGVQNSKIRLSVSEAE
jgi:sodium pump decarboxylase gamma subunit